MSAENMFPVWGCFVWQHCSNVTDGAFSWAFLFFRFITHSIPVRTMYIVCLRCDAYRRCNPVLPITCSGSTFYLYEQVSFVIVFVFQKYPLLQFWGWERNLQPSERVREGNQSRGAGSGDARTVHLHRTRRYPHRHPLVRRRDRVPRRGCSPPRRPTSAWGHRQVPGIPGFPPSICRPRFQGRFLKLHSGVSLLLFLLFLWISLYLSFPCRASSIWPVHKFL